MAFMFIAAPMEITYSFIIPVFNRPDEVNELLESLTLQKGAVPFEVVLVEDGSTLKSDDIVAKFADKLNISYFFKPNSGPGDSRNYGMERAKGNYFIILDSDCILPPQYIKTVHTTLQHSFIDCFGGPDAAHDSFTTVQKAINYAMTSVFTTGGIRGRKKAIGKFQPRSFNMGISKEVFTEVGGFGRIHPGEDPDLTIRIWNAGYETALVSDAYVYHKRRIDWYTFFIQVKKFGMVRPILNTWHPETAKITYWFPTLFCFGFILAIIGFGFGVTILAKLYLLYFIVILVDAIRKTNSLKIGACAVFATIIQFLGYGYGFLKSNLILWSSSRSAEALFPSLFFKTK